MGVFDAAPTPHVASRQEINSPLALGIQHWWMRRMGVISCRTFGRRIPMLRFHEVSGSARLRSASPGASLIVLQSETVSSRCKARRFLI
jgi:hypothetical protein